MSQVQDGGQTAKPAQGLVVSETIHDFVSHFLLLVNYFFIHIPSHAQ